jgi:hypothetical protein
MVKWGHQAPRRRKNMKSSGLKALVLAVAVAVLMVPAHAYRAPAANLENLVLAPADLPAGFAQISSNPVDNRELAKLWATLVDSPDAWLSRLETWQRTGGYRAEFAKQLPGPAGVTKTHIVFSEVSTFRSASGARAALAAFHRVNKSEELGRRHLAAAGMRLLDLQTRKAERLGDEGHLYLARFSFTQPAPGLGQSASTAWRRGLVIGSVTWTAIHSSVFEADVLRLSAAQDRRIRDAAR